MSTIIQAIARTERQLRELTDSDGIPAFKQVYTCPVAHSDMETPCAIIEAQMSTRIRVKIYHYALPTGYEGDKSIIELASICAERWGVQGRFGWITLLGCLQRTFQFELACE